MAEAGPGDAMGKTSEILWAGKLLLLFMLLSLTACSGGDGAPAYSVVTGVAKDMATGAPLVDVTITDGSTTVTTDAGGAFSLVRPVGTVTLTASANGYMTTNRVCPVGPGTTTLNWSLTRSPGTYVNYSGLPPARMIPAASGNLKWAILAWNDLGMHCAQDDYSYFCILPPFNTLHVQVIERGGGIVTSGITVSYAFQKKTDSTLHTNFWNFAAKYGWTLSPNVGLTGNSLAGAMQVDAANLGFVATGIPVTPYDDDGTWDPYGTATITVSDGTVTQTASVVVPISTELNCSNCHGTADTFLNILQTHDRRSGTALVADRTRGVLHLCGECHADNALGLSGKSGVRNLSLAMHGFHKDKVNVSADPGNPDCYNCHPGPRTNCLRGIMSHAGQSCTNCHGDMSGMAAALAGGRRPWLDEPRCGDCHGARYQENSNTLFRNSVFTNTPDTTNAPSKMNGKLYCEACHNSTHAEYTSTNPADNTIPQQLQGDNYWIWNCYVCHTDYMPSPAMHM